MFSFFGAWDKFHKVIGPLLLICILLSVMDFRVNGASKAKCIHIVFNLFICTFHLCK